MKETLHQGDIVKIESIKNLALLDLNVRGFSKTDSIPTVNIINITDAIQSIFDYI